MNCYSSLIVDSSRECLTLLARNCCVSLDKLCHYTTHSLDTEGKRSNIEKNNIALITSKHSTLNSSTNSNNLIWVYTL